MTKSDMRKMAPVGTLIRDYFPDAMIAVAAVAWMGNEKHNPGERMHWSRGKSDDHWDAEVRHGMDMLRSPWDSVTLPDGRTMEVLHAAAKAWRALAELQIICEEEGATFRVDGISLRTFVPE